MKQALKTTMSVAIGTLACLLGWSGLYKHASTSFGFIDPEGKIYETAFVVHRVVAQTICDSLGIKTADAYLTLERLGWVKFVGNGFFWDRHPTGPQVASIIDYAVRNKMAEVYINQWQRKRLLCDVHVDGTFIRDRG